MAAQVLLEMDFQTELNKPFRMRVYDAKADLTGAQVNTAMDNIIAKDIFSVTGGNLTGKIGAQLVTKETSELSLV